MTDEFIISRIQESECFRIGPYLIPRWTYSNRTGVLISVEGNRNGELLRDQKNPNSQGFEEFLKTRPDLTPVRELPVWTSKGNRTFYLLDYFFPSLGLVVELDSVSFHKRPEIIKLDKEKDSDLISRGFLVYRAYGFSKENTRKEASEKIQEYLETLKPRKEIFPINYSEPLIRFFRARYKDTLGILDSKPSEGIDLSQYILTQDEWEICGPCLKDLGIWTPQNLSNEEEKAENNSTYLKT